ncbi:MAG: hypothetical protein QNJ47_10475 [Nostocaceae cyanobacterium]|nr:hypothetical protein [Nostocaceae cyanobacterium]
MLIQIKEPPLYIPILEVELLNVEQLKQTFAIIPDEDRKMKDLTFFCQDIISQVNPPFNNLNEAKYEFEINFYNQRILEIQEESERAKIKRRHEINHSLKTLINSLQNYLQSQEQDTTGLLKPQVKVLIKESEFRCCEWLNKCYERIHKQALDLIQEDENNIDKLKELAIQKCQQKIAKYNGYSNRLVSDLSLGTNNGKSSLFLPHSS